VISALPLVAHHATAGEPEDKAAIESIWDSYSAAVVAGDPETWLGLWDDEGIQMPPGIPARGKDVLVEEIPKRYTPEFASAMHINPEEIEIAGDWAYSRGTYDVIVGSGGSARTIDGKFMTIFKREDDDSWKIYRDIFNSNTQ
jgi:uncharacterized protein (TIGR02246 family)